MGLFDGMRIVESIAVDLKYHDVRGEYFLTCTFVDVRKRKVTFLLTEELRDGIRKALDQGEHVLESYNGSEVE